jgi:hypothetical protein
MDQDALAILAGSGTFGPAEGPAWHPLIDIAASPTTPPRMSLRPARPRNPDQGVALGENWMTDGKRRDGYGRLLDAAGWPEGKPGKPT